jgi:hypothetical protein
LALIGIARLLCDGTNLREGGELKGKQDSGVSKPLLATSAQKPAASRELNCLPLIPAVKEYEFIRSAHTRNLS